MSEQEAGPALDADVAELMGWRAWRERRGEYALCVAGEPGGREPWLRTQRPDPERYTAVSCREALRIGFFGTGFPTFSRDVASAFLVVERMRQTDFFLQFREYDQPGDGWYCSFRYAGPIILASTAPLAICRAALSAVSRPTQEGAP